MWPQPDASATRISDSGMLRLLLVVSMITSLSPAPEAAASEPMTACASCHPGPYAEFLRHGMSRSLGEVDVPPSGSVKNDKTGWHYRLRLDPGGGFSTLEATAPDGGIRRQRVVGRLGAGIFDRSWAAVELDGAGRMTDRLFFAPVESVTGHGLELSPFELSQRPSGPNMPLGQGCLVCHTDTRSVDLPGAAAARDGSPAPAVHPGNALGADAFSHLEPLRCAACHGEVDRHLALMNDEQKPRAGQDDLGLLRLGDLDPGRQRDVCGRCHLQGDARFELASARPGFIRPSLDRPLAAQVPALVADLPPAEAGDDFRFVGQLERLAHSACFRSSPAMTCTTCHDPHRSVAEQGLASFELACRACHGGEAGCRRPASLEVEAVTGSARRGEAGCVDCHMRRSQPYDLPGIRSVDHFVRAAPPLPREVPFRPVQDEQAPLRPYDDGRLATVLATPGGRRWSRGLAAMAYVQVGRFDDAIEGFSHFPEPGSRAARQGSAPPPLEALEIQSSFHETRALAFLAAGRPDRALLAFGDALSIDPSSPTALLGRARLAIGAGDNRTVLADTQRMIELWPGSQMPWEVRVRLAERISRPDLALEALRSQVDRWPSDPGAWMKLGLLLNQAGREAAAAEAFGHVRRLSPLVLDRAPAPSPRR